MSGAGGNENRLPFKAEGQEWYSGLNHGGRVVRGSHIWTVADDLVGLSIEMTTGTFEVHVPIVFSVSVENASYVRLLEGVTPAGTQVWPYLLNRYAQVNFGPAIDHSIEYPVFKESEPASDPASDRTLFEMFLPAAGVYPVRPDPAFGRQYWVLDTSEDYWLAVEDTSSTQVVGVYWEYIYPGDNIPWVAPT